MVDLLYLDDGVDGVDDPVPGEDVQLRHLGLSTAGAHFYALTEHVIIIIIIIIMLTTSKFKLL